MMRHLWWRTGTRKEGRGSTWWWWWWWQQQVNGQWEMENLPSILFLTNLLVLLASILL